MAINATSAVQPDLVRSFLAAGRPSQAAHEGASRSATPPKKNQGPRPSGELSPQEQSQVAELKQRDAQVRSHEMAHMAVAGQYVRGGPSYTYQTGPDGRQYAIGGEVDIDSSPESTPEATLQKAEVIQRAATAPADPSPQDYAVAAAAVAMALQAQNELQQEQATGQKADGGPVPATAASPANPGAEKAGENEPAQPGATGGRREPSPPSSAPPVPEAEARDPNFPSRPVFQAANQTQKPVGEILNVVA